MGLYADALQLSAERCDLPSILPFPPAGHIIIYSLKYYNLHLEIINKLVTEWEGERLFAISFVLITSIEKSVFIYVADLIPYLVNCVLLTNINRNEWKFFPILLLILYKRKTKIITLFAAAVLFGYLSRFFSWLKSSI